jgi:two-component system, NtrC family, sensor kinase
MKRIEATAELFRIFAQDDSEKADVEAVNILKGFFSADAAALFYLSGRSEYRFCLAGIDMPIGLTKERWEECVSRIKGGSSIVLFGPWAIPGFGTSMDSWVASELYSGDDDVGYLLLGRFSGEWSEESGQTLSSISRTIAPIVAARIGRERAEFVRQRIEESLAASEKRLRSLFDDSRDMIYTANSEDVVTAINAAGLALLGREKHEIIGHPFSSMAFNPQDRESLFRRVTEDGYASDFEIILAKRDGTAVFCLETVHATKGPKGEIVELQGFIKDISERIKDERELWKTNMELAAANLKLQQTQSIMVQQEKLASIGQLAAGVAHEINNPLGFLKSNYAVLEKTVRTIGKMREDLKAVGIPAVDAIVNRPDIVLAFEDFDELFSESAEGLARIMRIVSNLRSFSRVDQSGEQELFDVNAGIESTLIVASNELKYVAETEKKLGELPKIMAKGGEINQVVLNLLVNAAQAIESQKRPEKGLIRIETALRNEKVLIVVSDDGPGIPQNIRTKIFDPFFTTKEPGKGTGLGLSISYDIIVAKHGGSLRCDSEPGMGTVFTIELPVSGPPA